MPIKNRTRLVRRRKSVRYLKKNGKTRRQKRSTKKMIGG